MSDYINKYKKRMEINGVDMGDAYSKNTIHFMESTFHASPSYRVMKVKGTEYENVDTMDGRVIEVDRMGSLREVLFRPLSEGVNMGAYLEFDGDIWLVFDRFGQSKALVERCNRSLKWYDKNGINHELDCIASATDLGSKSKQSKNELEWNKFDVRMPLGQLFVFVELTEETKKIGLNDRFIFGENVYEVTGRDDTTAVNRNGHGVLQLTIKLTITRDTDDFVNQIAHNTYTTAPVEEPTTEPVEEPVEEDEGGMIW